ncbi:helix-turn-helix domain-containing protein [uncultured Amnibacterium sp.]|uniref:helix-turn-helix domain-containing protein n=1 Tax=uncultured Amnibacterium sp. TaxID=1631851 RepID=UPI0035C95544
MRTSSDQTVPIIEWDGQPGFERFSAAGRFAVPDARRFRSQWREVAVDGVQVGEWSTSPISGVERTARTTGRVLLVAVVEGSFRYWTDGRAVDARSGTVHLLSSGDQIRFAVPEPSRILRISVPSAFLPQDVRVATATSIGPVPATRVTAGLTSLVEQVLDPVVGGAASPAARAVRALAVAALEDSVPDTAEHDLRGRILEHIERHIGDLDLGPQSIAGEFGISLRWVHHVFNVDGASVARHIRERRLDVVAAQLQTDRRFPRIGALAERTGFASRDQLTRAFKARYGVTIAEYAALASEGRAPEPQPRTDEGDDAESA